MIRDLNPSDINKLVSVSGMITRTSNVIPDLRCGAWLAASLGIQDWQQPLLTSLDATQAVEDKLVGLAT